MTYRGFGGPCAGAVHPLRRVVNEFDAVQLGLPLSRPGLRVEAQRGRTERGGRQGRARELRPDCSPWTW